jgi:hypothetical protein
MSGNCSDQAPLRPPGGLPWQDADPPKANNVMVYFFAKAQDETRVIIKQERVNVADFYTQDVGANFTRKYTSPGRDVEY